MSKFDVLNNPVWNAMNSGNSEITSGGISAKSFLPNISPFVGLKDFSKETFDELTTMPTEKTIVTVTSHYGMPTDSFEVIQREKILQMVFTKQSMEPRDTNSIRLENAHIPAMLELADLTRPGPFLNQTIRFGNYFGIFNSGKLAAMAGRRFHPAGFIEISAVCTHPEFAGKGYAGGLIINEAQRILAEGCTPFLHSRPNNKNAIRLYEKLGFTVHQEMNLLIFKKTEAATIH